MHHLGSKRLPEVNTIKKPGFPWIRFTALISMLSRFLGPSEIASINKHLRHFRVISELNSHLYTSFQRFLFFGFIAYISYTTNLSCDSHRSVLIFTGKKDFQAATDSKNESDSWKPDIRCCC